MEKFKEYLIKQNLAERTISSYLYTMTRFFEKYNEINKKHILSFKGELMEHFNPKTVNLRLQAINKYLDFLEMPELKIKFIKIQQKTFLENVISDADYNFLKSQLKKDKKMDLYFVIRYLCATGARVSELVQLKVEHVQKGYYDIYSKGGKCRRIYIPINLQTETIDYIKSKKIKSGYFFLNKQKKRISTKGIQLQIKSMAKMYGISENVLYPHSFRHRFAKNFLEKYNDIALLADLMGHESIETTRIYLRKTSTEQQTIVNDVVTW